MVSSLRVSLLVLTKHSLHQRAFATSLRVHVPSISWRSLNTSAARTQREATSGRKVLARKSRCRRHCCNGRRHMPHGPCRGARAKVPATAPRRRLAAACAECIIPVRDVQNFLQSHGQPKDGINLPACRSGPSAQAIVFLLHHGRLLQEHGVCVDCLFLRSPSRVPYRTELIPRAPKGPGPPTRNPAPRIHRRPSGLPTALQEH